MQINLVTNEEFVAALTGGTKGGQRRTNLLRAGVTFCRAGEAADAGTQCRRGQRGRQCS